MVFPSSGARVSRASSQKKGTSCLPRGQTCFVQCGCAGRRHRQGRSELMLSTDVTLAPHTASAACACKGARAGHSKIPQGKEGKAPGIFKPQLLHPLYSRERKVLAGRKMQKGLAKEWKFFLAVFSRQWQMILLSQVSWTIAMEPGPVWVVEKELAFWGEPETSQASFTLSFFPTGSFCSNHKPEKLER